MSDIPSGQSAAWRKFDAAVEEVFDNRIATGIRYPAIIGLQKETVHGMFVSPPDAIAGNV